MKDYYTFNESNNVAKLGTPHIIEFLKTLPTTLCIVNVENVELFQKRDIDLVLVTTKEEKSKAIEIEIKVDTYYNTGNYFFETVSNDQKKTEGCFMYSEADLLFYYFIEPMELHILPLKATREWFKKNSEDFKRRECKNKYYSSIGALVPRQRVLEEVKGCCVISLKEKININ